MECPHNSQKQTCVCESVCERECVCVCHTHEQPPVGASIDGEFLGEV